MTTTIVKPGEISPRKMDTRFIGRPHEWDPRRLYSQTACDWQQRIDFERMRRDRLQRLRDQMTARDLGALVLFAGANIRYATGSYQGNWKYNINIRYCVLPNGGEPVLFETAGSDLHCAEIDMPWMQDNIRPAITWQWAEGAVPDMADRMVASVVEVLTANGGGKGGLWQRHRTATQSAMQELRGNLRRNFLQVGAHHAVEQREEFKVAF